MMKSVLIIVLSIFIVGHLRAQKDPETLKILQEVEKKGLAYKTIQSDLTYHLENKANDIDEEVKGSILIKGEKFKLDIDKTITICNGKIKWVYLEESNEVTVTNLPQSDKLEPEERFMNQPLSVFSIYKTDFKYGIYGLEDIDGKTYTLIDLTPESLNKPYFKIRYWISADKEIFRVKYFQKDGMRITLDFVDMKVDIKLAEALFEFNKNDYPDVEVIDIRE